MKNVLFVSYGGGHINIIDLIAQQLLGEKGINFKILALTAAYPKVSKKYPDGIVNSISDYMFLFDTKTSEIYDMGKGLLGDTYIETSDISKEDLINYFGISMLDLINQYGQDLAQQMYFEKGKRAFLPIETMKKILTFENIDTVVSTTSPRFEQASLMAGNELDINTIEILDLFDDLNPPPEAQHIVCMNQNIIDRLTNRGLKDRSYYPFGQPVVEESAKKVLSIDVKKLSEKIGINNNDKTILYAAQDPLLYLDYINESIFDIFDKIHKKYHINILFRMHPNGDIADYQKYFDKFSFVMLINDTLSLHESLAVSDIVITPYSTVGLEAVVANKLVLTYKHDKETSYPVRAMTKKPFIFSNDFKELRDNLEKSIDGQYVANNNYIKFGAVDKIIDLIKELS